VVLLLCPYVVLAAAFALSLRRRNELENGAETDDERHAALKIAASRHGLFRFMLPLRASALLRPEKPEDRRDRQSPA
jgi:hypothetical protein